METKVERKVLFHKHLECLHSFITHQQNCNPCFMVPVNEKTHLAPGYHKIIKEPMDLGTMEIKLKRGEYDDNPWDYNRDFFLVVENAIRYNGGVDSPSRWIADEAIRLERRCSDKIDDYFRRMGFCCGRRQVFEVRALACYACRPNECHVGREKKYYLHKEGEYSVCDICFRKIMEDESTKFTTVYPEQNNPNTEKTLKKKKKDFEQKINDECTPEPFIKCSRCSRYHHQICVNFFHGMEENHFVCFYCRARDKGVSHMALGSIVEKNPVQSKMLVQNPLSIFIQQRIRELHENYLKDNPKSPPIPKIRIRVLSTNHHVFEVKEQMAKLYSKTYHFPASFPYKSRAIFAFQEQPDGREIAIFAFHVNEYGDEAKPPNHRMVYLSYLDSVQYFQPEKDSRLRMITYHEIVLSYMQYVQLIGYQHMMIWSCPPHKSDDYIFYCHPKEQKIPDPNRLLFWYRGLLDEAIHRGIIKFHTNLLRKTQLMEVNKITQIPYLAGDFWPILFESTIKEVLSLTEIPVEDVHDELTQRIRASLDTEADVFFFVDFKTKGDTSHPIAEIDIELPKSLFDGREEFLTFCRKDFHEFRTHRNACHSTTKLLFDTFTSQQETFKEWFEKKALHYTSCDGCERKDCIRFKRMASTPLNPVTLAFAREMKVVEGVTFSKVWDALTVKSTMIHANVCRMSLHPCNWHVCKALRQKMLEHKNGITGSRPLVISSSTKTPASSGSVITRGGAKKRRTT